MQIRRTLLPGQKGAKKFRDQYGAKLLCVRYRYDRARQLRVKTVELIVETAPWVHPSDQIAADALVGIKIAFSEVDLQRQVKQAGGKWDRTRRLWEIRYDQVVALNLKDRIEPATIPNNGKVVHA